MLLVRALLFIPSRTTSSLRLCEDEKWATRELAYRVRMCFSFMAFWRPTLHFNEKTCTACFNNQPLFVCSGRLVSQKGLAIMGL